MLVIAWVVLATASLDRTGRSSGGRVHSAVTESVHYVSVQVGGKGNVAGDVHAKWEKDINVGTSVPVHVSLKFQHPAEQMLDSVSLSGSLLNVGYEATRCLSKENAGTDLVLGYSLPGGTQLTADANVNAGDHTCKLQEVSAFHPAGPFNVQPSWLLASKILRIKLGRGAIRRRCPVSLQTDFKAGSIKPQSAEIGLRHLFNPGRKMRARLLMPSDAPSQAWVEYEDDKIDKRAVWFLKAALPLQGKRRMPEVSLRRAWQW